MVSEGLHQTGIHYEDSPPLQSLAGGGLCEPKLLGHQDTNESLSKENQEPFSPSPFMLGAKVELNSFRTWVRFAAGRMFVANRQLSAAGRLRSACCRQARFLWFWVTVISWPQTFQPTSDSPAGLPGYRLGVTSEVNRIPKGRTPTQVRLEPLSNSCCLVCVSGGLLKAPERRSHCVSKAVKEGHPIHLWESITSHRCRHLEYRLVQGTGLKHFFFFIYLFFGGRCSRQRFFV